jgi:hypothetical protein
MNKSLWAIAAALGISALKKKGSAAHFEGVIAPFWEMMIDLTMDWSEIQEQLEVEGELSIRGSQEFTPSDYWKKIRQMGYVLVPFYKEPTDKWRRMGLGRVWGYRVTHNDFPGAVVEVDSYMNEDHILEPLQKNDPDFQQKDMWLSTYLESRHFRNVSIRVYSFFNYEDELNSINFLLFKSFVRDLKYAYINIKAEHIIGKTMNEIDQSFLEVIENFNEIKQTYKDGDFFNNKDNMSIRQGDGLVYGSEVRHKFSIGSVMMDISDNPTIFKTETEEPIMKLRER